MDNNGEKTQKSETIEDLAEETLRQVLTVLGLREADDQRDHDFNINVFQQGRTTVLEIDPDDSIRGFTIGKEAQMLAALNTIVLAAVNRRLSRRMSVRVDVRGYQPPLFRVLARREGRREDAKL
jgi:predicted RNA-binding protein Jag